MHAAHAALADLVPALAAFDAFTDPGGHLQISARWCHNLTPADRLAAVTAAAHALGAQVQSHAGGNPRHVTHWACHRDWRGRPVVVSAVICECHDGLAATLGHFEDTADVVARAAGAALREMLPAEAHPMLAAAETVLDVEQALRAVR